MLIATKNTMFVKGTVIYVPLKGNAVLLCTGDTDTAGDTPVTTLSNDGDTSGYWSEESGWLFKRYIEGDHYGRVYFDNNTDLVSALVDVFIDRLKEGGHYVGSMGR